MVVDVLLSTASWKRSPQNARQKHLIVQEWRPILHCWDSMRLTTLQGLLHHSDGCIVYVSKLYVGVHSNFPKNENGAVFTHNLAVDCCWSRLINGLPLMWCFDCSRNNYRSGLVSGAWLVYQMQIRIQGKRCLFEYLVLPQRHLRSVFSRSHPGDKALSNGGDIH